MSDRRDIIGIGQPVNVDAGRLLAVGVLQDRLHEFIRGQCTTELAALGCSIESINATVTGTVIVSFDVPPEIQLGTGSLPIVTYKES